jgi:hypothetical protein
VLLPILTILVTPGLPVFSCAIQLIPTLLAILLEIVARLLPAVAALVPGVVPMIDSLLPLLIAILRTFTPIWPLFRAGRAFACTGPLANSRPLCGKLRWAIRERAANCAPCCCTTCNSKEIANIRVARALTGLWSWTGPRRRTSAWPGRLLRWPVRGACAWTIARRQLSCAPAERRSISARWTLTGC